MRLWVDANHNGLSEPAELFSLPAVGMMQIRLGYERIARRDQHGNLFKYKGQAMVVVRGVERPRAVYDVFLTR